MSPQGGIWFLPRVTEVTKRSCWSCGNLRRSNALSGSRICGPWQGAQLRSKISAPARTCSGAKFSSHHAAAHVATSATTALITLPHIMRLSKSFRHQRKGPYRTSGRHVLEFVAGLIAVDAADAGQDRHVLPAVLRERHRL